ncbi:MAG: hypothetical protein ACK452_06275, partial [Bacteroidota bacterium]
HKDYNNIKKVTSSGVSKNIKTYYSKIIDNTIARIKNYDSLPLQNLENDYANDALTDLVRNKNDLGEKFLEKEEKLIQRVDPIFNNPENNFGRAHFFAPQKKFFGKFYPTFWFNILVIWLMTLVLGITLYLDLFRRFLDFTGNLFRRLKASKKDD